MRGTTPEDIGLFVNYYMKIVHIIFFFSSIIYKQQGYPVFPILQIPEEELWDAPFSYGLQSCIKPTAKYKGYSYMHDIFIYFIFFAWKYVFSALKLTLFPIILKLLWNIVIYQPKKKKFLKLLFHSVECVVDSCFTYRVSLFPYFRFFNHSEWLSLSFSLPPLYFPPYVSCPWIRPLYNRAK